MKLIEDEKPVLILLDILLPQKDGFEVIDELKSSKDKTISSIPTIVLLNLSNENDQCEAKRLGAIYLLIKAKTDHGFVLERVNNLLTNIK